LLARLAADKGGEKHGVKAPLKDALARIAAGADWGYEHPHALYLHAIDEHQRLSSASLKSCEIERGK